MCTVCLIEAMMLGQLRPTEWQILSVNWMRKSMLTPAEARLTGTPPYVCLSLVAPTKGSRHAPAGILLANRTRNGVRVGKHHRRLLWLHARLGRRHGRWICQPDGSHMSQTYVIQHVLRPALHRLQMAGVIPEAIDVDAVGMNTFRRGGATHARDRLQGLDHKKLLDGHGRWSDKVDDRGRLPVPDRYDGLSVERKLVVSAAMW